MRVLEKDVSVDFQQDLQVAVELVTTKPCSTGLNIRGLVLPSLCTSPTSISQALAVECITC